MEKGGFCAPHFQILGQLPVMFCIPLELPQTTPSSRNLSISFRPPLCLLVFLLRRQDWSPLPPTLQGPDDAHPTSISLFDGVMEQDWRDALKEKDKDQAF
jgi:hypothetical protein